MSEVLKSRFINIQIEEVSVFLTDVWYSFNLNIT